MPYNPNGNWTARTNAGAKSPVYYIEIDGLTTKHFSTGPVRSAAVTKKVVLKMPDSVGQKLSQLQGKATLNLVSLELVDKDGEITDLVSTEKAGPTLPTLINRKVMLKSGYMDLAESDYAAVAVGQISTLDLSERNTAYKLDLVDLKRHANDELFRNAEATGNVPYETRLTADAALGAKQIAVVSSAGLNQGEKLYLGPSSDAGYTGQEEKVEIALAGSTTIDLLTGLTKAFKSGDEVRWATTFLEGNPFNILYGLLTGDFAHASFPIARKRGEPTGLGLTAAEIESAVLIKERDNTYDDEVWRFEVKQPRRGFTFIEKLIQRWLGFPYMTIDGKLSFRAYRPEYPDVAAAGLPQILKNDVLSWSWKRAHELHINRVRLGIDFSLEETEPAEEVIVDDTADQTATKESPDIDEPETGLRAALRGNRLADDRARVLLRRFTRPPVQLVVVLPMTKRALQMGEVVELTHADIPDVSTGTRGLTKKRLEIVEREERFAAEKVVLLLQDAGFVRPAAWAPDSVVGDYDSASAADKEYACWAPDAGNFADGGSPYEIV